MLDWDDARVSPDPHRAALDFGLSAVRHACAVCGWDPALSASVEGVPRRSPFDGDILADSTVRDRDTQPARRRTCLEASAVEGG
jgi:hypothetical protein